MPWILLSALFFLPSSVIGASGSSASSLVNGAASPSSQASNNSSSPGVFTSAPLLSSISSTSQPPTETGVNTIPIAHYSFEASHIPSGAPIPEIYPATDPSNPPPVGCDVIPDFNPAWAEAQRKAREKIHTFSLEQKVNVTTGVGWTNGRCVGNIPNISDWPGLCLEDSPLGVRFADYVTAFPAAINVAATFNRRLMRQRGLFMGLEHRAKGVNVVLGPMMNMGRLSQGGRNWEGFGADPYLTGESAYETILGLQQAGVQACAKHLVGNEQEHARTMSSSNIDDRTLHEVYSHPFLRSVMAGVGSMMCSYNLLNATYACENDRVLNDIVKREYGFQGYIMSDWQATHSTLSAIAGLDMTMPGDISFGTGNSYFGANLTAYVHNGTIPESRVDDMATRILASWYLVHQDSPSYPRVNFDAFRPDNEVDNEHIDVQAEGGDHAALVREIGSASTVLLKNKDKALPLGKGRGKVRSLVLVGSDAGPPKVGPNTYADMGGDPKGVLAMGWGSGTANFTYLISPLEAIQARARKDRTSVSWFLDDFDLATAGNAVRFKGAAIVFINSDSGEGYITVDGNEGDRKNLTAWHGGDRLIQEVAAQNNNTIVVAHSVGPLIVEPWIDHPNVTAVLWSGLPGEEAGHSIADVLYGDWNPSGKLPYTIAKRLEDYPAQLVLGGEPNDILSIPYVEALEIDYRHFDAKNITPRFEFGFGLSYTDFKYCNLCITKVVEGDHDDADLERDWEAGMTSPSGEGSSAALWLHRPAYNVTFDVENIGDVYGCDVPQLYVNHPPSSGEPPSVLKGFVDVALEPGESKSVTMSLSRYDLSIWDVIKQGWKRPDGTIWITIGASSRDRRLYGRLA